jgi:hypothetical protein
LAVSIETRARRCNRLGALDREVIAEHEKGERLEPQPERG